MTNYTVKEKNLNAAIGTGAEIQRLYNSYLESSLLFDFHPINDNKPELDNYGTYGLVFDLRTKQYYIVGCGVVLDWVRQGELIPKENEADNKNLLIDLKDVLSKYSYSGKEELKENAIYKKLNERPGDIIKELIDIIQDVKGSLLNDGIKKRLKSIYDNSTNNPDEEITLDEIQTSFERSPEYIIEFLVDTIEALEN